MARYPNFESAFEGFDRELCKASRTYGFGYTLDCVTAGGFVNVTIHSLRRPSKEYVIQYDHIKTYSDIRKMITTILNNAGYLNEDQGALPKITKVIFNPPATIVFWSDNTKTVVKCQDGDYFDPEKGLTTAISKKALGNQGNYNNEINKWLDKCDIYLENYDGDPLTGAAYNAYHELLNVFKHSRYTKLDLEAAINEAIGYLGEVLAE